MVIQNLFDDRVELATGSLKPLVEGIVRLMINQLCTCSFIAGIEALKGPQNFIEQMVAEFKQRHYHWTKRDQWHELSQTRSAFYVFPNVKQIPFLVKHWRLPPRGSRSCLVSTAFGKIGDGYLRIS